jgi:hypothetical protein
MTNIQKYAVYLFAAIQLTGCGPDPTIKMDEQTSIKTQGKLTVTRVGVFKDTLAYGNLRGIYEIKDNETGKEYFGISGIGISEIGHHSCGKSCYTGDER